MKEPTRNIEAIQKRIEEVIGKAEYMQNFSITIKGKVEEFTTIEYDITEVVKDWEE